MKRLLFFAAVVLAIGSIGGHTSIARAQSTQPLTPEQTAALEQQLSVAKATLANLEMQAGNIPRGDSGSSTTAQPVATVTPVQQSTASASTNLSSAQISAFNNTLNTLAIMLTQLNTSILANATLTSSQQVAVANTLGGMKNTLVAMATTVNTAANQNSSNGSGVSATSPVATQASPSKTLAQNTPATPSKNTPTTPVTPSTPVTAATQSPTVVAQTSPSTNNNVQQTAQASSIWSFTKAHWPTIVIVLLVLAILAILFWPEKETVRTVTTTTSVSNKPKVSAPGVTVSQTTISTSIGNNTNHPAPATPVASAVAAPVQK
jgi:hypothetical protein